MLPPPTTTATSTPRWCTRLTVRAIACRRSGSTPYSSPPSSASPDSFSSTRRKAGFPLLSTTWTGRICECAGCLLADREPREPPDHHVLPGAGGDVGSQLLDRAALVLVRVHVDLLQEHDLLEPLAQPAFGDLLAHLGRLGVVGLRLEDGLLAVALVTGHVLLGDPARCGRRDVHGHLPGEVG